MIDEDANTRFLTTLEILKRAGLERAYAELVSDIANTHNLVQNAEGLAFVHSKYDELTEYINANCVSTMAIPEIKVVIQDWMAQQAAEVVSNV